MTAQPVMIADPAIPPPSLPSSPSLLAPKMVIPRHASSSAIPLPTSTPASAIPTVGASVSETDMSQRGSTPQGTSNGSSAFTSIPATTASLTTGTTASSHALPSPPDAADSDSGLETGAGTSNGSGTAAEGRTKTRSDSSTSKDKEQDTANSTSSAKDLRSRTQPNTGTSNTSLAGLAPPVTQGTPLTGARKMAAAAAVSMKRAEEPPKPVYADEDHPLSDKSLSARGYHTLSTLNHHFHVPERWRLLRPLGQGAYGLVISVQDELSGEPVAIKCITRVFDKPILARRALREITLLRHFGEHENLTGLIDLDNVWDGYNEIYMYIEPMEADLHQIVRSGQTLSNLHIQFFLYQILRGMKYIHSANVIHRDLKPGNLLVNSDCELKICDFGLARGFTPAQSPVEAMKLTEYVATRWYRAPEIMLSNRRYDTAMDVWSIGCILGELLGGRPLFKGKDYIDQLNLILGVLGTPDDETLDKMASPKAAHYVRTLPKKEHIVFESILPDAEQDAIDLLDSLLAFDPAKRLDVATALEHPYVSAYHDPADEPICATPFDKWEMVENLHTTEELRDAITREIAEYRAEVRGEAAELAALEDEAETEYDEEEPVDNTDEDIMTEPISEEPENEEGHDFEDQDGDNFSDAYSGEAPASYNPTLSPDLVRSQLGVKSLQGRSPTPAQKLRTPTLSSGRARGVSPFPRQIPQSRDSSPFTPRTADTDDSFGSASGAQTASVRRPGYHAVQHRRSMSFLFGGGMGMTSLSMSVPTGSMAAAGSALATGSSGEPTGTAGTMSGRRSRAPSSTATDLGGALRPLIRRLSTTNIVDMNTDDDLHVTHSAGECCSQPPSGATSADEDGAITLTSRRGSRRRMTPVHPVPVAA